MKYFLHHIAAAGVFILVSSRGQNISNEMSNY
jgi:hypothetical protein